MFSFSHFATGFILGVLIVAFWFLLTRRLQGTTLYDYLATPSSRELDFDWVTRQFLRLFSAGASERWYEARVHLHRGRFVSMLAAYHLVHVICIEYATEQEDICKHVTFLTHGFQSKRTLMKKLPAWIETKGRTSRGALSYVQTFIAGYSVVDR